MRRIFVFGVIAILFFLIGCRSEISVEESVNDVENEESIVSDGENEKISDEGVEEEKEEREIEYKVKPEFVKRDSLIVSFKDFRKEVVDGNEEFIFDVGVEDMIKDSDRSRELGNYDLRDPVKWFGYVMTDSSIVNLFLCGSKKEEDKWGNSFCIDKKELPKDLLNGFWFVYSAEKPNIVVAKNGYGDLNDLERTYLFKVSME